MGNAHGLQYRCEERAVAYPMVLQIATQSDPRGTAHQRERDLFMGVRHAPAQFIAPYNQRVVQHAAITFRNPVEETHERRQLSGYPLFTKNDLALRAFVRRVRQNVS